MKNFNIFLTLSLVFVLNPFLSPAWGEIWTIDSFDTAQKLETYGTGSQTTTVSTGGDGIIGSYRTMTYNVTENPASYQGQLDINADYDNLYLNQGTGVKGNFTILWDADGSGMDIDLTSGTNDRIIIYAINIEQGKNINFTFTVVDIFDKTATLTVVNPPASGSINFIYSTFINSGGINWTHVKSIAFDYTGDAAADLGFDWILAGDSSTPVELTSFTVETTNQGVLCKWTTESETENLGFLLERRMVNGGAANGWKEIASYKTDDGLLGQGSTSSYTDYEYLDKLVDPNTVYEYRLADIDYNGVVIYHATREVTVERALLASVIEEFTILPAYPNPFNPSTTITYGIDTDNKVTIDIYDITGKLINTLQNGYQTQGWHTVIWNGTNQHGEQIPAGIYISKITSGSKVKTNKLMLLK